MLIPLVLFIFLGLVAVPTAVTAWALIEADRTGALNTEEYEE